MQQTPSRITKWLESAPTPVFATYAIAASFATYFCMYAFRKPFAAAEFEGLRFLGTKVDLKQTAKGRGRITIHFNNPEEFERLRAILSGEDGSFSEAG